MSRAAVTACALLAALLTAAEPPAPYVPPAPRPDDRPLPISLPTALQLADGRALDVVLARQRVAAALAALDRANVLWLPSIDVGIDYTRHDGRIQDVAGNIFSTSKSGLLLGAGPNVYFAAADALFAPLAARQVVRSRRADAQAAANDTLLAVAEAYFNLQQARGELAGHEANVRNAEELVRRAGQLAPGLAPPVEASRARAELARRRQVATAARERWRLASAELARIDRLDPATLVEPVEPPFLQVTLVDPACPVDDLIATGLRGRPELASRQALVEAALALMKQERVRPLVPSVILRGAATPTPGLAGGYFGGGINDQMRDFGARSDWDVQLVWELQNLGLGNRARVRERRAEYELALTEVFRVQDRVAAEVAQAFAQVQSARERLGDAEVGFREALDSFAKNLEGLSQTRRAGEFLILVVRPQEVVAAVQALGQANADYYGAVADYNRAQFRLYRAMGQPAQCLPLAVTQEGEKGRGGVGETGSENDGVLWKKARPE